MLVRLLLSTCLLAVASLVSAGPNLRKRIAKPLDDPFYQQPANIASYQPGDIIRHRVTPGPIGAVQQFTALNLQGSYQLMYATTSAVGDRVAAVTTVIIPHNPSFDKVLGYQAAYDSTDPNCSPSFTLQQKSNNTAYDPLFMAAGLNQGWIVSTADYEGLEAQFVAGVMSGHATLDAMRATLASKAITGVLPNATTTLWGYSGGALACEWALELQPTYAPELKIAGAAFGGLTPNITNVINSTNKGPFSWQIFAGINGLAKAYSNLSDYVNHLLIPATAAEFRSINFLCSNDTQSENDLSFKDAFSFFYNSSTALDQPIPKSVITWGGTMGLRSTPTIPFYLYKAIGDEISPVADSDAIVKKYCAAGASIKYSRNLFGEHVTEAVLGSFEAFSYLTDRMNGVPVPKGCSTKDVLITDLSAPTLGGLGDEAIGVLKLILTAPLGPSSIKGL